MDDADKQMAQARKMRGSAQKMQFTIPIVVHVLHKGEPVGVGTNISDAQILSAIDNLNDRFSGVLGTGPDMEIDFCIAGQYPEGNSSSGINRINAFDVCDNGKCYKDLGMVKGSGGNENALKDLSRWNNCEYYNIWVVSEIDGNDGQSGIQGFAYFPNSPSKVDGTVILYNAFGTEGNLKSATDKNTVITHEMGHAFGLYHTFQGDQGGSNCPSENDCVSENDFCCDTPPHIRSASDCNSTGTNACDGGTSNSLFVHNYMDYSSQDCMSEFTLDQKDRMHDALNGPRSCLVDNDISCNPPCELDADFRLAFDDKYLDEDVSRTFENESTPSDDSWIWKIDGVEVSNDENLTYTFSDPGKYTVCLQAFSSMHNCSDIKCKIYTVVPTGTNQTAGCETTELPKCELLLNGNLSQGPQQDWEETYHFSEAPEFGVVCNWVNVFESPEYCYNNGSILLWKNPSEDFSESMGTTTELNLVDGEYYTISFDYCAFQHINRSDWDGQDVNIEEIIVELSDAIIGGSTFELLSIPNPANNETFFSGSLGQPQFDRGIICSFPLSGSESIEFQYDESQMGKFLSFKFTGDHEFGSHWIKIDNVRVDGCGTDFTFTNVGCEYSFLGQTSLQNVTYTWDFGDGSPGATGQNVSHTFLQNGTYNVCMTITCPDPEDGSLTECKEIEITNCDQCVDVGQFTATKCDGAYLAEVEFTVPAGTVPCDGLTPQVHSDDVYSWIDTWAILPIDATNSTFVASVYVSPPAGYDLTTTPASITYFFCDENGNRICFEGTILGEECDICNDPITSDAVCNEQLSMPGMYVHEGSVDLGADRNFIQGDIISDHPGFNGTLIQGTATWSLDYTITTNDFNATTSQLIVQFLNTQTGQLECVRVVINIPEGCVDNPCEDSSLNCDVCEQEKEIKMDCSPRSLPPGSGIFISHTWEKLPGITEDYDFCGYETDLSHLDIDRDIHYGEVIILYTSQHFPPFPSNGTVVLCFESSNGERICFTHRLVFREFDCLDNNCLSSRCVYCIEPTIISSDGVTIPFIRDDYFIGIDLLDSQGDLGLCPDRVIHAEIEGGGTVTINSFSTRFDVSGPGYGRWLADFDIDIEMPLGYDPNEVYVLTLYLCDEEGNEICYEFPFNFKEECPEQIVPHCGYEDTDDRSIAFTKGSESNFTVYPNPLSDQMTLVIQDFDWQADYIMELYNLNGRRIMSYMQLKAVKTHYDLSEIHNGVYIVRLLKDGATIEHQRVIVHH